MTQPMFKTPKKRKPRRTVEEKSAKELVKVADKHFSEFIRLRDSTFRDDGWYGACITCSKRGQVARLENGKAKFNIGWNAGHFVTRGHKITRFDEQNVHLQCAYRCNNMKSGEYEKHRLAINRLYGEGSAEALEALVRQASLYKLYKFQLLDIISDYKARVNEIVQGVTS